MQIVLTQPPTWTADAAQNFDAIARSAARRHLALCPDDVLVLPELIGAESSRPRYETLVSDLARSLSCWVVGGSHHCHVGRRFLNRGLVSSPSGHVEAEFEKNNPYGREREIGVNGGTRRACFTVSGRRVLVSLCADFFHAGLLAGEQPDVVAVPAFSVTRLGSAGPARTVWRHMAAARSYELGAYVAISDWAPTASYDGVFSGGVAGVARPYPSERGTYFEQLGTRSMAVVALDFDVLNAVHDDRRRLGFLVRSSAVQGPAIP